MAVVLALVLAACGDDDESGVAASGEFAADAVDFPVDAARERGGVNAPNSPREDWLTLDPGTYVTGLLGTEVQFTTSDPWKVAMAEDGALILEWPEVPRPFTRALLMLRPAAPAAGAEDFDPNGEWIEEVPDVEILDRREVTVDDTDAVVVDVTATAGAGNLNGAIPFLESPPVETLVLRDSEITRVWVVDQGASPTRPLLFFVPVVRDDTEWLAEADAVIESMVLGPVQEPLAP